MELKNQVSTLEQAKIFKDEFGLELDTYLVWHKSYEPRSIQDEGGEMVLSTKEDAVFDLSKGLIDNYYPAYSCAELGVLLPDFIDNIKYRLTLEHQPKEWHIYYCSHYPSDIPNYGHGTKYEAHAKAALLIHLLKEKIINPKDLTLED